MYYYMLRCRAAAEATQACQVSAAWAGHDFQGHGKGAKLRAQASVPFAVAQVGADGDALNGWVSDAQLAAQITALNVAFAPLAVTFAAAGVSRIKGHREWWCADVTTSTTRARGTQHARFA